MLVSTYQHDYKPPNARRYEFMQKHKELGAAAGDHAKAPQRECHCHDDIKIDPPKAALDQCGDIEWTGIAPLGRLVEPRIIPTKFSDEQVQKMALDPESDCFKDQPNRFLKVLSSAFPDLYERLKQMPKDELNRRMDQQRLYTTYQIDFCNMNEFPEGVYESMKGEEKSADRMNASKLMNREGPCAEFRAKVMEQLGREEDDPLEGKEDPCGAGYKPMKVSFADSSRFVASGNSSHWRSTVFTKKPDFTEYMDTINKIGCVIMKNNLHNHSKCVGGKHCRHQLIHICKDLGRNELVEQKTKKESKC